MFLKLFLCIFLGQFLPLRQVLKITFKDSLGSAGARVFEKPDLLNLESHNARLPLKLSQGALSNGVLEWGVACTKPKTF